MPQKPLLKPGKKIEKKQSANRHGKTPKMKKGKFDLAPKKSRLVGQHKEEKALTKAINASNESLLAGKAAQGGGRLAVMKAPPPVLAPAVKKAKAANSKGNDKKK